MLIGTDSGCGEDSTMRTDLFSCSCVPSTGLNIDLIGMGVLLFWLLLSPDCIGGSSCLGLGLGLGLGFAAEAGA